MAATRRPSHTTRRGCPARRERGCNLMRAPVTVRLPITTLADRLLLMRALARMMELKVREPAGPSAEWLAEVKRLAVALRHGESVLAVPVALADDLLACIGELLKEEREQAQARPDVGLSIALVIPAATWGTIVYIGLIVLR